MRCIAAGLEAEVIPGITSAIAVPGRAGIPVTLRRVSSIFTVVSGHSGLSEDDLAAVEATLRASGTVVLLMGVRTLPDTVASLLSRGIEGEMPLATIENGFSGERAGYRDDPGECEGRLRRVKPPAITVIGEVVYYTRDDQNRFVSEGSRASARACHLVTFRCVHAPFVLPVAMPAAGRSVRHQRHSPASLVFLVARDAGYRHVRNARGPAAGLGA